MSIANLSAEQRVVLRSVSWDTFTALADREDVAGGRMTFDRGVLEIMSPRFAHESAKVLLRRLIERFAELQRVEMLSAASTTFRRQDLQRGFEADESYYFAAAPRVRRKADIDLAFDPPPDLVVEIELTRSAIDKLELFAAVGVREVWRYDGQTLWIGRLEDCGYRRSDTSRVLEGFPVKLAEELLLRRDEEDELTLVRRFIEACPGGRSRS